MPEKKIEKKEKPKNDDKDNEVSKKNIFLNKNAYNFQLTKPFI